MRFLLIASALGLIISSVYAPLNDWRSLGQARALRKIEHYDPASRLAERVMKTGCMPGFRRSGHVLLHEICLDAGDSDRKAGNYADSWDWYIRILETPGNPEATSCERPAQKALLRLIDDLLDEAEKRWVEGADIESVVDDLSSIRERASQLELDDRARRLTRKICSCRMEYANKLLADGQWEDGLEQLLRITQDEDASDADIDRAFSEIPRAIACQRDALVRDGDYLEAFEKLDEARARFSDEPAVVAGVRRLEDELEVQVFGVNLIDPDTTPSDLSEGRNPPTEPGLAHITLTSKSNYPLRFLFRGPSKKDVPLPPHGNQMVKLLPGPYLLALIGGGGKTIVQPKRSRCDVEAADYYLIWFPAGKKFEAEPGPKPPDAPHQGPVPLNLVPFGGDLPNVEVEPRPAKNAPAPRPRPRTRTRRIGRTHGAVPAENASRQRQVRITSAKPIPP